MNGLLSDPISITRGTRQGCPLSPLLFAVATEPLAVRLRQHHTHRAIRFSSRALTVSLYADDVTLYMVNPVENLAPMTREIVCYGALSGIHINWNKSVLFPLTTATTTFPTEYPFVWASGPTRYLGIWLSRDVQTLWSENYGKATAWLEDKIKKWKTLPLSLAGRIAITKMTVLPKFLYLFVNLPIPLTRAFLTRLRSLLIELVWAGKQPRIAWEVLTLPCEQGGMAAPDLPLYAYCAQAQFLQFWLYPTPYQPHVAIELDKVALTPLATAVFLPYKRPRDEIDTVQTMRWAWQGLRDRAKLDVAYAPTMTILHNPLFPPLLDRGARERARARSITTGVDLFPDDTFLSLHRMCKAETPTAADTLLYYQLRATCKTTFSSFPRQPPTLPPLDNIFTDNSGGS